MFLHQQELINEILYVNPDYKNLQTKVNHKSELTHNFKPFDGGKNYLIITIDIVFTSSVDNVTIVARTTFSKDIQFDVTEHKAEDDITLQTFLIEMTVELKKYLEVALPKYMIKTAHELITKKDLDNLKTKIMVDLVSQKFY